MQTLRKKTSPLKKYRNEPARFFGDGVIFKAKLIGILEVGEARGDRMCQEALQDLKVAIRAAGEHKQRITIHVTIEGLRLRDEKTGESLYHHPVHKISFIAQDMTDSRAFGYIFGSPDCGHRFFGIKTDKAASQVVLAMRDLFQCVFELKKKEIELAKQHIQNRITAHEHQQVKNSILDHKKANLGLSTDASKSFLKAEKSPEASTANLVDLEQELSSIQRGISQMERITPNEEGPVKNMLDDDPFGDSFTSFSSATFNILPPPASSKRNQPKPLEENIADLTLSKPTKSSSTPPIPPFPSQLPSADSWFQNPGTSASVFDEPETSNNFNDDATRRSFDDSNIGESTFASKTELTDAFTDLDPLGTGKSRPYVDKKFFFQDLKNPPKRVLKDLSEPESVFDAHFSPHKRNLSGSSSLTSSSIGKFDSIKSIDPFEEEDFSKINLDQFESTKSISPKNSIILPDTKISSNSDDKSLQDDKKSDFFNAPLHVDLPSEWGSSSFADLRRQVSEGAGRNVFSVDSFSKKLQKPNLFGQRNVKRDSNGINMRRLQESDSLSENEPELPPRPETGSLEPPPLPPKNHRESVDQSENKNSYSRYQSTPRYEYSNRFKSLSSDTPPLPLPSRKINRTESSFSSTSRTYRKCLDEDDYLTPNPCPPPDIPALLPPPQKKDPSKMRILRKSETDPKNLDAPTPPVSAKLYYDAPATLAPLLPDITLSQLLTLGIDDLADKLNVPVNKLSTMTIVELTKYLSEFIEKSKETPLPSSNGSPVFKVNFDDSNDATFVAKFDDSFGETEDNSFVANFENFNQTPVSVIPTADRYAVFREIIDQEIESHFETQHQESIESNNSNSLEDTAGSSFDFPKEFEKSYSPAIDNQMKQSPNTIQMTKIDTKITEAISNAKDRYAALRDIILVEDLFDKSIVPPLASISDSNLSDDLEDAEQVFETAEIGECNSMDNVPTYNISWADAEAMPSAMPDNAHEDQNSLQIISTSNKEDFEIDEYMKKAISELSLDQRLSPNVQNKSPSNFDRKSPSLMQQSTFKPTSPLPLHNLPRTINESSFEDQNEFVAVNQNEKNKENNESESKDNEMREENDPAREKTITPSVESQLKESGESWAVFEQDEPISQNKKDKSLTPTNARLEPKEAVPEKESPYSSDGKNEYKQREKEYHRRWPKTHTSSSSRDASPWDEDPYSHSGDFRRRPRPHHPDSYHPPERYIRPPPPPRRRTNSGEEYEDEYERRPMPPRQRTSKAGPLYRSKEVLDTESPSWHYPAEIWSDEDEPGKTERKRPFDRNDLRSTYGPPYDKRDAKSMPYDRRDYRTHDKRSKYYRPSRNDYDFEGYEGPHRGKPVKKEFDDYEENFERGARETRSARDYFYDRDRKSFDSNESFESGRGHRKGSGEISGSYEGRDFRDRDKYTNRSLRRSHRNRGSQEHDLDSEEEPRKHATETGSLQRPAVVGPRSKHIHLDDEVWGSSGKNWKRPSSASAGDRMSGLSGSDGEKEKRYRRKQKPPKGREVELRSNYATIRYSQHHRKEYYEYEDDGAEYMPEEPSPRTISPRSQDLENAPYYASRRKVGGPNPKNISGMRNEPKNLTEHPRPAPSRYPEESEYDPRRVQSRGPGFKKSTSRDLYIADEYYPPGTNEETERQQPNNRRKEPNPDENFEGFESDFNNTSPKHPEQQKFEAKNKFSFESEFQQPMPKASFNQQKLRFNENVSISKFDAESSSQQMFEDDFLEWNPESATTGANIQSSLKKMPGSNLKTNSSFSRHENIKNSDSVNIFSRKNDEDPFENDDFFNDEEKEQEIRISSRSEQECEWNNKANFANFDDNKNI